MALRGTLTHRKTRRLARLLDIDEPSALGILEALWHVTSENQRDGGIGRMANEDIIEEMFCRKDPDTVIDALIKSGWIDEIEGCRLYVHDWHVHSDDTIDNYIARGGKRYANGAQPRMKRLSKEEKARLCDAHGYLLPSVRTESHNGAEPEPYPEPNPDSNNDNNGREREFLPGARMSPPAPIQVIDYLVSKWEMPNEMATIEGEKFIRHYAAVGWKRGNTPIADWKPLADLWVERIGNDPPGGTVGGQRRPGPSGGGIMSQAEKLWRESGFAESGEEFGF